MGNVEKLRVAYQRWHDSGGTSVSTWLDLSADDIAVRSAADGSPGLEYSAPATGRADLERFLTAITKDWEMLHFTPDDFIAEGDRVVMVGRCGWRHKGTGKAVESPVVHVWRFRDGKVTEMLELYDTARAVAAATV
jgi:hypothetical protein